MVDDNYGQHYYQLILITHVVRPSRQLQRIFCEDDTNGEVISRVALEAARCTSRFVRRTL